MNMPFLGCLSDVSHVTIASRTSSAYIFVTKMIIMLHKSACILNEACREMYSQSLNSHCSTQSVKIAEINPSTVLDAAQFARTCHHVSCAHLCAGFIHPHSDFKMQTQTLNSCAASILESSTCLGILPVP